MVRILDKYCKPLYLIPFYSFTMTFLPRAYLRKSFGDLFLSNKDIFDYLCEFKIKYEFYIFNIRINLNQKLYKFTQKFY